MKTRSRALLPALIGFAVVFAGCNTTPDAPELKTQAAATAEKKKAKTPNMPDVSGDLAFQAFASRLRQAVHQHDANTLASMMTTDFGYRLEPPGEGPGVFEYWDQNNIWPELELILKERFIPNGNYMVAPAEFSLNSENYTGFRAGIRLENGGWKFAYFVSG